MTAGGGFNAMAAARRMGVPVTYGGMLGEGPLAEIAVQALQRDGIAHRRSGAGHHRPGQLRGDRATATASGASSPITARNGKLTSRISRRLGQRNTPTHC